MGRLVTYLTILIVMDLLFIITGQLCVSGDACSLTSVIFSMAIHPGTGALSDWFSQFIGKFSSLLHGEASNGTIGSLLATLATAGVAAGSLIFGLKNDSILFASTGVALSLLIGDFINIFDNFYTVNPIIAILIFSPITIIYIFTCLEWVRGMP